MITLGTEIISLRDRFGAPWSEFAFMLRYPDWSILLHSLTSDVIACDEKTTNRILAGRVTKRDARSCESSRLMIRNTDDDRRLFEDVSAKVHQHLEKASITTLLLIVTDRCNLRCVYCFENLQKFSKRKSMSLIRMKEAVDHFLGLDRGEKTIFFYGGEPLTEWENVKQCIQYVRTRHRNRKVNLQITTNGTVCPERLIEFCKRHNVGIAVSIDGPAEITNATRRSPSRDLDVFQRSFQLLCDCRDAGLKYAALCTISHENAGHLEKIIDFFIAEKITGLALNLNVRRAGESIQEDSSFWDDLGRRMAVQYQRLMANGVFEPRGLSYLRGIAEGRFTVAECDAGYRGQIVVDPEGLIGPCQAFLHNPDFWIPIDHKANIRSYPLWLRFSQGTTLEIISCRHCPFVGTCSGGCRYNRNDFGQPNPNFCCYIRSFLYHTLTSLERR